MEINELIIVYKQYKTGIPKPLTIVELKMKGCNT
jgi:hypothetical protein